MNSWMKWQTQLVFRFRGCNNNRTHVIVVRCTVRKNQYSVKFSSCKFLYVWAWAVPYQLLGVSMNVRVVCLSIERTKKNCLAPLASMNCVGSCHKCHSVVSFPVPWIQFINQCDDPSWQTCHSFVGLFWTHPTHTPISLHVQSLPIKKRPQRIQPQVCAHSASHNASHIPGKSYKINNRINVYFGGIHGQFITFNFRICSPHGVAWDSGAVTGFSLSTFTIAAVINVHSPSLVARARPQQYIDSLNLHRVCTTHEALADKFFRIAYSIRLSKLFDWASSCEAANGRKTKYKNCVDRKREEQQPTGEVDEEIENEHNKMDSRFPTFCPS